MRGEWSRVMGEQDRVNLSVVLQNSPGAGPLLVLIGQGNTLTARYRSREKTSTLANGHKDSMMGTGRPQRTTGALSNCMSYFSHSCDNTPKSNNLRRDFYVVSF